MSTIDDIRHAAAVDIHEELANPRTLSKDQATLYSQAVRLTWNSKGLPSWTSVRAQGQMHDAARLLEAAHIARELGDNERSMDMYRRAGDIFEWLSRSDQVVQIQNEAVVPLRLLAAASFQLAGLPAMAAGLLTTSGPADNVAPIFAAFLSANFNKTLELIALYWKKLPQYTGKTGTWTSPPSKQSEFTSDPSALLDVETIRCIGLIAGCLRWQDETRLTQALKKLRALSVYAARSTTNNLWLFLHLVADVAEEFQKNQTIHHIRNFATNLSAEGQERCARFSLAMFHSGRPLLWRSQQEGIRQLATGESFALCTPTGSGKTTIAELALLQALDASANPSKTFSHDKTNPPDGLALYLVPSRALAAEIESKLAKNIGQLAPTVKITSIYQGTDWSIADAWVTAAAPALLICTVEMAESIIRFAGPSILKRLRLTIVDEAHQVLFSKSQKNENDLKSSRHRGARLEYLMTRIFAHAPACRAIALSAVAGGSEDSIARWICRESSAHALGANYRSTRQLVGGLECSANGSSKIRIELVNGEPLTLKKRKTETYVPLPFPEMPEVPSNLQKELGSFLQCHALWSAIQLAQAGRTTLISVPEKIELLLEHMHKAANSSPAWREAILRVASQSAEIEHSDLYNSCLAACKDYCGVNSYEYSFLSLGIAVHHGQLPAKVRRLMTEVIRQKETLIAIATSTLTEGVNLPFDTILLPSLIRSEQQNAKWGKQIMGASEFLNLAGRAGRPGTGFEGLTLVLLPSDPTVLPGTKKHSAQRNKIRLDHKRFKKLLESIKAFQAEPTQARSPLTALLETIRAQWQKIHPAGTEKEFISWLEQTAPITSPSTDETPPPLVRELFEALDSLDLFLLSAIAEAEQLSTVELPVSELEMLMQRIWKNSFSQATVGISASLEMLITARGRGLHQYIYPNRTIRESLYKLGLPPSKGSEFRVICTKIREHLKTGYSYEQWSTGQKLQFIETVGQILEGDNTFRLSTLVAETKLDAKWDDILAWWLRHPAATNPSSELVRKWLKIAISGFEHRLGTAIGIAISTIWSDEPTGASIATKIDNWQESTGMPWIAFWLRELVAWGTLEPVAAFLMATGSFRTRQEGEIVSYLYYDWHAEQYADSPDDKLHPRRIGEWYRSISSRNNNRQTDNATATTEAILSRDFPEDDNTLYTVVPLIEDDIAHWLDCAGYTLATGNFPASWSRSDSHNYDYRLNPKHRIVQRSRPVP